jgi:hypothetical protein
MPFIRLSMKSIAITRLCMYVEVGILEETDVSGRSTFAFLFYGFRYFFKVARNNFTINL